MIFTVAWWPDSGTRDWVFLYNANTQELFEQTKMWDKACLKSIQNFKTEILCCGMTRLRNTNLDVFIQCQYTRTILRKENMGQSLIKKRPKFLNLNEVFYCCMTRLRNMILNYSALWRYVKTVKPKKVVRQNIFKNHLKFQNFNIQ